MQLANPLPSDLSDIQDIIRRHGAARVLFVTLRSLLIRKAKHPPPTEAGELSAHLRRDVGLPPVTQHAPVFHPTRHIG